ncbi:MAG: tetratricopeptide repeat protein [Bacteroidales bacterium]|nr:tetratricopeptide repeat protein [Bacteroidales bacterium]
MTSGKSFFIVLLALASGIVAASPAPGRGKLYRQALDLYENAHYEAARVLFESMGGGDATAEGYVALCALKMRTEDSGALMEAYRRKHPSGGLANEILLADANNLFDDGKYEEARADYSLVDPSSISDRLAEYYFKFAYTQYAAGIYPDASSNFEKLEALPWNDFTAGAYYLHGVILYNQSRFQEAVGMFAHSVSDPRFKDLSEFYTVDCEFNLKNYGYVLDKGVEMYQSAPKERQEHLARMISESYLVTGDKEKAREYFDDTDHADQTRSDIFYAGSVLYAVEDYKGAIEQFTRMTDRSDSLGQIANYHLGNAYVRTRNKVAAMESFRDAASVGYDLLITEDALFNYAKLAFDLNKDTQGFAEYIKKYSTKTRGEMIYSYMALAALVDKDYSQAISAYDNIDELAPDMKSNYTKANFLRANQLMENGSWSDAVTYLRTCGYYLPKNDRFGQLARYWLAESYFRTGNYNEAEKVFLELYNSDALYDKAEGKSLAYNIAYCHLKQGSFDSAAKWFDNYIASPDASFREDAFLRRADCDFLSGDYKAAIKSYQKALDEFPDSDNLYALYRKGMAQGLAKDKKGKVATLTLAEDKDPSAKMYPECLFELGRTRNELKSYKAAASTFEKLRRTAPDNINAAKALLGLGLVSRNSGDNDSALESYKEVVSLLPGSEYAEEAMKAIESIYKAKKQPEKYREYLEKNSLDASKEEDSGDATSFNTAEQVFLTGNWQQAVQSLQQYLDDFPTGTNRIQARYYLAESLKAMGDKEKAAEYYLQVADSGIETPSTEMSRLNYASILLGFERYSEAYKAYGILLSTAKNEDNVLAAKLGMMRSAFGAKDYSSAIAAADKVTATKGLDASLRREAGFVKGKSCFSMSRRNEAMEIFRELSADPSTPEGAESVFLLMSDSFDRGDFERIESLVYDFSTKAGDQSYWLARAYILLGDSFVERGMYDQAKATFDSIADGYEPESGSDDILETVNQKLNRLAELKK